MKLPVVFTIRVPYGRDGDNACTAQLLTANRRFAPAIAPSDIQNMSVMVRWGAVESEPAPKVEVYPISHFI